MILFQIAVLIQDMFFQIIAIIVDAIISTVKIAVPEKTLSAQSPHKNVNNNVITSSLCVMCEHFHGTAENVQCCSLCFKMVKKLVVDNVAITSEILKNIDKMVFLDALKNETRMFSDDEVFPLFCFILFKVSNKTIICI